MIIVNREIYRMPQSSQSKMFYGVMKLQMNGPEKWPEPLKIIASYFFQG